MYRDNSLIPSETVRLAALGLLTEAGRSYGDLASEVRHLSARLVGPSLDLLGPSIELLKVEELAVADGEGLLSITDKGRAELQRLLKAALRGPIGEVNKLIIALKLMFLDALAPDDRLMQVEMLAETFEQELARLTDLRGRLAGRPGLLLDWLDHDIHQVEERIAWFRNLLGKLEARSEYMLAAGDEDLRPGDIAEIRAAKLEHGRGHLVGRAHAMHGDARDQAFIFGADHRRLDFARRHGIDSNAQPGEFDRHLAGQGG